MFKAFFEFSYLLLCTCIYSGLWAVVVCRRRRVGGCNSYVQNAGLSLHIQVIAKMLLCVIVQLLSACNVLALAVSEIEYLALQSLYNSTNGNDWVWDGSGAEWNFNRLQDPCLDRWEGVTCPNGCNPDSCTILGLALPRHNMTGSIPEDIDGLLNLVYLDLSYNRVGGSLPESIGGLNSLQYLNLEFMCLMGKFPTAANFSALQFLNLRHNFFHGPIPGAKNLPLIKDINLSYNRADTHVDVMDVDTNITYLHSQCPFYNSTGFEGSVSSSFWGLSMMTNVSLKGNSLTGPILIDTSSPLAPLESLHLSNNLLVGPILRLVEYFPSIRYLDLSCNQFNGQIRSEIFSAITEVIYFNISDNIFRGSLPSSIGSLSNIQTLSMFANILQYSIPERITVLSALKHLSLGRGNCFTGPIPDSIGNLTSLEYLEISGAQLTGAIPMSLSNLRKLREINLRYNKEKRILTDVDGVDICQDRYENGGLSGPLHPFWLDMPYIEYIDLSRNWFNMSIPDTFGFANNLKVFSMQDNLMSGNLPNFTGAPSLQRIALDSNFLAGPLPPSYAQLHRLKELSLAQNILTGVIPPEWAEMKDIEVLALNRNFLGRLEAISSALWTLTKLRILYLEYNRFAGSIPSEVSNLVHLEIFSVANNRISGSIPPQLFSMCSRLYAFDVANNSFTGRIPSSVVSAQFLDAFSAEGNKLTNSIPTEFVRLTNLAYLRLGANYLNGTLPDWKYFMPKLEYFSANSNQLTGTIPRSTNDFLKILSVLYLNNNTLDGSIPAGLLHSPSLLLLDLSSNCLQGSIPEVWDSADLAKHQLTLLALYNNKLTGPFPKSVIEHNPFIATFVIYMNIFTGPVPDYTKMPYVNVYAISRNRFTGTLPEYKERPELSRLIYFDVADNNLGGVIPTSLGYHNQIATLFLQNNRFEGTIPTNFSYPDLKDFRLHTNRLTGALPAWVGESDRLGNLFVHQNFLSGDLNLVLHNNRQQLLDHIDVSDNLFTGSLPAGVFTMPKLSSFAASKNCFSGQFPSTLCNTTSLEYLVLDALSSSLT